MVPSPGVPRHACHTASRHLPERKLSSVAWCRRLLPLALKGSGAVGFLVLIVAAAGVWGIHGALLLLLLLLVLRGFSLCGCCWSFLGFHPLGVLFLSLVCLTLVCTVWLAACSLVPRQQKHQLQASGAVMMCSLVLPYTRFAWYMGAVSRHPFCVQLQAVISSGYRCAHTHGS